MIPFYAITPIRPATVVKERIVNFDSHTIEINILGEPNGLAQGIEHKRMMIREHANGRKDSFFISDDEKTELVEWKANEIPLG